MKPSLEDVLESAAKLQELVPGAVLVGGSAAALYAHHRQSFDHDHVIADLAVRFETILEHLEALGDWSMTRAQPGKIILGELGGIETGVRQLLRGRPLESVEIEVGGRRLVVPSAAEILRIKAWLALSRNQTRDYLDIAALATAIGFDEAAAVLAGIDDYYADLNRRPEAVATQLVRQLADPRPRDAEVTAQLADYKALDARWQDWSAVKAVLADLAERMMR
ncbi:MAG: hypothetical protein ABSH36_02185 [Solirubrobacteraceae bacterium]